MNNKIKKLPKNLLGDFRKEQTELIKSRLRLAALLLVICNLVGDIIGMLALQEKATYQMQLTWTWSLLLCLATYFLAGKIRTFRTAQASALLFIVLSLATMTRDSIAYHTPPFDAALGFVFMLFAFSFIFPWSTLKSLLVSLLHFIAFDILLINVPSYIYKGSMISTGVVDYVNGFIALFLSAIVCFAVIKRERERDLENYILFKDVEEKNDQMEKELKLATKVHSKLIPHSTSTNLADIAVTYLPMHYIGGDYAKFHFIDKHKLLFIICDVTGHGVSAALTVNALNTEFERLSKEMKLPSNMFPGEILKSVNMFMLNNFSELNMYMTAFCGLLDFHHLSRKFTYSSYGHPPQYIYHSANPRLEKLAAQTSFLGLPLDDKETYNNEVPFGKNDSILLFTDGVLEARDENGEEYGSDRVEAYISKNRGLDVDVFNNNLLSQVKDFAHNDLRDDLFILNIKTK